MTVILVKATDPKSQGECVRIDSAAFNPEQHELYGDSGDDATAAFAQERGIKLAKAKKKEPTAAELKAAAKQQEEAAALAAKNAAPNPTGAGDGVTPPNTDPTAKPAGW